MINFDSIVTLKNGKTGVVMAKYTDESNGKYLLINSETGDFAKFNKEDCLEIREPALITS